jgi:hypothetical protein
MRTAIPLLALTALLATATLASATDQEKFLNFLGKYAVSGLGMPTKLEAKTPCYCTPGSVAPAGVAGYLVHYPVPPYEYVNCYVPIFAADGSLQGTQYCNTFAVIGK